MGWERTPIHVSLLVVREAMVSSLGGIHDALTCFEQLGAFEDLVPRGAPYSVELVG